LLTEAADAGDAKRADPASPLRRAGCHGGRSETTCLITGFVSFDRFAAVRNLLFIKPSHPVPPDKGEKIRGYNLIMHWQRYRSTWGW